MEALRNHILAKGEVNPEQCWIYLDRLGAHSKVVPVWFRVALFYGVQILHELQEVFADNGVDLAFPTQPLHLQAAELLAAGAAKPPAAVPETAR